MVSMVRPKMVCSNTSAMKPYKTWESGAGRPVEWDKSKSDTSAERLDAVAITYDGFNKIPDGGDYKVGTAADDGSLIYIDGIKVVDNDGKHALTEKWGDWYHFAEGFHEFHIDYFEHKGKMSVKARVQAEGINAVDKGVIPGEWLFLGDCQCSNS